MAARAASAQWSRVSRRDGPWLCSVTTIRYRTENRTVAYGGNESMGYDVIVVGARVAGASTAMLLARQGLRVLVVDRVSFPSDTISSHQVQVPGIARLHRWG